MSIEDLRFGENQSRPEVTMQQIRSSAEELVVEGERELKKANYRESTTPGHPLINLNRGLGEAYLTAAQEINATLDKLTTEVREIVSPKP